MISSPTGCNTQALKSPLPHMAQLLSQHRMPSQHLPSHRHRGKGSPRCSLVTGKAQGMLLKFTSRLTDACQQECRIPNPPAHLLFCLIFAFDTDKQEKPKQQSPGPLWAQHIHLSEHRAAPESCSHPGLEHTCLWPCEHTV